MRRNDFLGKILTAWTAIVSLPIVHGVVQYLLPPERSTGRATPIPVGERSEFGTGSVRLFREGDQAFFLQGTASGQLRAFSARCTHLGCIVEFLEEEGRFRCNCHGSLFDLEGNNLTGPARLPLKPFRVEVRDDRVSVTPL